MLRASGTVTFLKDHFPEETAGCSGDQDIDKTPFFDDPIAPEKRQQ
jgi:hypothetical protein